MTPKKVITILWQFDPRGGKIGGIGQYVLSFVKHMPAGIHVYILGVTTKKHELFTKIDLSVTDKKITFIPILYINNQNNRGLIPISVRYVIQLKKSITLIPQHSVVFSQRPEYMLALNTYSGKKSVIFHYDISEYISRQNGESVWKYFPKLYKVFIKNLMRKVSRVICINKKSELFLVDKLGLNSEKVSFAPTWCDSEVFNTTSCNQEEISRPLASFISQNRTNIVCVGRINKTKKLDIALSVVSQLKDSQLIIVGEGHDRFRIEKLSIQHGICDRVFFTGMLDSKKVASLFHKCQIYLSVSSTEGMSVALLEALACGIPSVTTPTGEARSIIINGENGYVTDSWSENEIITKIRQVQSNPKMKDKNRIADSVRNLKASSIIKNLIETILN